MKKLTHINSKGLAKMVDVSSKPVTLRYASARGSVRMKNETLRLIADGAIAKGDVIGTARIAGIMAVKKTPEIIPLCHPLNITAVDVEIKIDKKNSRLLIESKVKTSAQTGVEMEALTAVSASALTIYDMCKAVDKEMVISEIVLIEKRGGKSDFELS
ncbi:MAG: cyclic pyranopterin monophosphate synthase MoaC [Nitrospirae bacterium]|nr:cyclic pyranopterin monophosphate synthase MoaC [Nitrospirota bacterium]